MKTVECISITEIDTVYALMFMQYSIYLDPNPEKYI